MTENIIKIDTEIVELNELEKLKIENEMLAETNRLLKKELQQLQRKAC